MNPRIAVLLFLSALTPLGLAQTPGIPSPPLPGAPTPANGGAPPNGTTRLQFPNVDIGLVLKVYERLTGKRIITDNSAQGPVNIDITNPVPNELAIRIIETNLNLNGFSLVQGPGDIVKVLGTGKNPRQFSIGIYSDIAEIPDDVSIVSVLFQLKYADPNEIKKVVDLYDPASSYTATLPLPGALLVTESSPMVRNIAKIIAAADVAPAEVVSKFYRLERATAKDVLDKMNKLFEKTNTPGGTATPGSPAPVPQPTLPNGAPAPPGSVTLPAALTGLSEDAIIIGKIKLDADERTNRIHVVTRPVNLRFIEELIAQFDSDIQFGTPAKRALKFVSASDMLDIIVKAITEPGAKAEGGADNTAAGQNRQTQTNNTNGTNGGVNGGFGNNSGGSSGGVSVTEELNTPAVDTTPRAVTVGSTKIIADPRENTIIVLGNDEVKSKVFALLDQLDVRAPQVMINTVIGEFSLTNDSHLGVDYLLHYPSGALTNLLTSGTSVGGLTTALSSGQGFGVSQFTGTPAANALGSALGAGGGFTAAIGAANSLEVIVNALESTGRFHITNTPSIMTSNNKKAIIVSGQEIAVPTSTLSNLNSTGLNGSTAAVQSDVQFKQVALQLEVVPLINSDREVSLDILQKLDSPSGTTQSVGGSNIPTINTRYIKTNVSVPNKATYVLGGLITKTVGGNNSQMPFLGRIPILGYLFGSKTKQLDRSELIVLIRPVVANSPAEMAEVSHVQRNHMLIEPDVESTISEPTPAPRRAFHFRYRDDKQQPR